jgi:hypothetical protein
MNEKIRLSETAWWSLCRLQHIASSGERIGSGTIMLAQFMNQNLLACLNFLPASLAMSWMVCVIIVMNGLLNLFSSSGQNYSWKFIIYPGFSAIPEQHLSLNHPSLTDALFRKHLFNHCWDFRDIFLENCIWFYAHLLFMKPLCIMYTAQKRMI